MLSPPPGRPKAPPPLRTDGSDGFARYSMSVRVPKILEEVSARNPDYPAGIHRAITRLGQDIRDDARLPPLESAAPGVDDEWEPALAARAGDTWLDTDWFFAECYAYRCLMSAVRYWETGRDPFAPAKAAELASDSFAQLVAHTATDAAPRAQSSAPRRLRELLVAATWGNRVDLSYTVGVAFGAVGHQDDLLADDGAAATGALLNDPSDVHVVADNAGSELAVDLILVDFLLAAPPGPGAGRPRVTLHVKMHPTFVSDAVTGDVWTLLDAFERHGATAARTADRLRRAWADGSFRLLPDPYWNGPRFLWDRPPRLRRELDRATAVILKGDANYRRAVGDASWPLGVDFREATAYLPARLVALRTMKSDALVGISAAVVARLDTADADWRINGRRGVIQVGGASPTGAAG